MHPALWALVGAVAGLAIGILLAVFKNRHRQQALALSLAAEQERREAELKRQSELREAELKRDGELRLAEEVARIRERLQGEIDAERRQLAAERERQEAQRAAADRLEQKLHRREETLGEREQALDGRQTACDRRETRVIEREEDLKLRDEALLASEANLAERASTVDARLEEIAGLSREAARDELLASLDAQLLDEQARLISKRTKEAETRAKELATEIVGRAIQRYAAEHTAETTTAKVTLTDDDMKGRIIGKEGRNIRSFEQVAGVDLIVDDTPGIIVVSCFDGVRREIARRALLELLADGRIHPARIEEVFVKVRQDLDREVLKLGEDAAFACDISGLHPNLLKLLGKLQYRTSYGQNVLQHTQEVAFLTGAIASDLGMDPKLARRCGLLHDIGKALDHEQEGSHPELGYEALKRWGEGEIVANAALAHHEGRPVLGLYTTITAAADAISAARPGARRDNVERYIKRLEKLEDIACSFAGVVKAYAIQAGRELRVIINGHTLVDAALPKVARAIANRIEEEVAYPGEVRVVLIRETREMAVAR